jgi:predicted ATPase/class 3 adenylate cyclase
VTVLFADLKGSMELLADRDPEEARKLLDPVLERMMEAVHRYEGTVNQVMGDGIMALFGAPVGHEDHAVRACYAALDMQAAIRRYAEEMRRSLGVLIQIRVGLNSGEVVVRAIGSDLRMDYTAVGQTTHLAARMEQLAKPDSTLLTADVLRLAEGFIAVATLGLVPVKGLEAPIEVYEMTGAGPLRSRLHVAAARGLTRFVGRESELDQLRQALSRASSGHGQVAGIMGEPGVGKSRLVWETTHSHRVHGWLVLQAGAVSYGKATSYLPVVDLLKGYFAIEDRDSPRAVREKVTGKLLTLDRTLEASLPPLLSLLDVPAEDPQWPTLEPPERRRRTLDAVKRLLLRESQVQPLLVVFEDLHWIDSETQALLDALVESLPAARMFLLVNYRPEYEHPWASRPYYTQLPLDALPLEGAEQLLGALLGPDAELEPLKRVLIARTEGNPFFLEESVRSLAETGALLGKRGAYQPARPLSAIQIPATARAVLAARIDRLSDAPKRLLQTASILGREVPLRLLAAIWEEPEELGPHLRELTRLGFLHEHSEAEQPRYVFRHALTQEVAYASLLTPRRQALHAAAGRGLEALHTDGKPYALLAHHFRAAGDLEKALAYHAGAAEAARHVYAVKEALEHYTRALDAAGLLGLDTSDRRLSHLHMQRGQVAAQTGDVAGARAEFEAALQGSQAAGDRAGEMQALNELGFLLAGAADYREGIPRLDAALGIAEALADRESQATILSRLSIMCTNRLQFDRALEHARRALEFARDLANPRVLATAMDSLEVAAVMTGDLRTVDELAPQLVEVHQRHGDLWYLQFALFQWSWVPIAAGRWDEAIARLEEARAVNRRIGDRGNEPMYAATLCWIHRSRGEYGRALAAGREAARLAQDLDHAEWIAWSEAFLGWTLQEVSALAEASRHLERGLKAADRAGAPAHAIRCASHLAWTWWLQGEPERAHTLAEQAEGLIRRITTPPGRGFVQATHGYVAVARVRVAHRGAGHEVRVRHQHEDREGPRPHDPAVGARAGG